MESTEYEFKEYQEQFEAICKGLDKEPLPGNYMDLIALDNTITGLESTRFPGNSNLLNLRSKIRKRLAG